MFGPGSWECMLGSMGTTARQTKPSSHRQLTPRSTLTVHQWGGKPRLMLLALHTELCLPVSLVYGLGWAGGALVHAGVRQCHANPLPLVLHLPDHVFRDWTQAACWWFDAIRELSPCMGALCRRGIAHRRVLCGLPQWWLCAQPHCRVVCVDDIM